MISATVKIHSILKNSIFLQKFNSCNSFDLYKYYIIIAIIVLSIPFFVLVATLAESSLNASSTINSTDVEMLYNKANTLYDLQKYDEALQSYDKALTLDPLNVNILNNKAVILQELKRYDEALEYYNKRLAIDPSDVTALNNKALV